MKIRTIACSFALFCGFAQAQGAFTTAADAIEYRQAAFMLIKENFADMGAMMRNKKPMDAAAFTQRAQDLARLAPIPFSAFKIANSVGGNSAALATVWSQANEFNHIAMAFEKDANALALASRTEEDPAALRQAFGAVAKHCKGCHQQFKAD
ncbi:MAG: cytochrome c [Ferrimonas sp.]